MSNSEVRSAHYKIRSVCLFACVWFPVSNKCHASGLRTVSHNYSQHTRYFGTSRAMIAACLTAAASDQRQNVIYHQATFCDCDLLFCVSLSCCCSSMRCLPSWRKGGALLRSMRKMERSLQRYKEITVNVCSSKHALMALIILKRESNSDHLLFFPPKKKQTKKISFDLINHHSCGKTTK